MDQRFSIQVSHQTITHDRVVECVRSTASGAIVLFLGTAREFTQDRQTSQLTYEAYAEMAERELAKLAERLPTAGPSIAAELNIDWAVSSWEKRALPSRSAPPIVKKPLLLPNGLWMN